MIHGLLNVDKPQEWTSHDAVAKIRRVLKQQKVGHAGSLDPNATGVLLLCLGKGTKLSRYFMGLEKEYHAFFRFGAVTDTQDADGEVLETRDAGDVTEERILEVIGRFRGEILQTPPMVSAVKVGGKRLYRYARKGETVERKPRPIHVRSFELVGWNPPVAEVKIACSKGTYVRTLAADMGDLLGCGAYLDRLTRTRIGPYRVEDALTIERIAELAAEGRLDEACISLEKTVEKLPTAVLRAAPGRWGGPALPSTLGSLEPLDPIPGEGEFLRIRDRVGRSVGVVQVEGERGHLRRVFSWEGR
ncbi:MAG: tRNA pseudouridine(55) synthase TruB [Candidatus Eisenbacteria bacterium]|nr:tRNA pseudouridine(55) synthase TruB [Candidatus Eisenbacteria bacterium]